VRRAAAEGDHNRWNPAADPPRSLGSQRLGIPAAVAHPAAASFAILHWEEGRGRRGRAVLSLSNVAMGRSGFAGFRLPPNVIAVAVRVVAARPCRLHSQPMVRRRGLGDGLWSLLLAVPPNRSARSLCCSPRARYHRRPWLFRPSVGEGTWAG
jgi:hypothetical protein